MFETVYVECDAPSHDRRVVEPLTLDFAGVEFAGKGNGEFTVKYRLRVAPIRHGGPARIASDDTFVPMKGRTARQQVEAEQLHQPRARWRFRCPECGDCVRARHDKLEPVIVQLARHNVSHVTLTGLRGIL